MNNISLVFLVAGVVWAAAQDSSCGPGFLRFYSNHYEISPSSEQPPFEIVIDEDDLDYEPGDDVDSEYTTF